MNEELQRISVLLVDDEENILRSLKRLLMDEDFDLETACSGEDGLEKLAGMSNVGLIISDQRMPGMNGAEFLGRSQEVAPNALRILLTGYSDINATIDAINKGGAYRYLSKPWNDDDLLQTVRDAIRQYCLMDENRRLNAIIHKQNEELKEWNQNLKSRVLEQTTSIRMRNDELKSLVVKAKNNYTAVITAFSSLVELQGGKRHRHASNVAELSVSVAREIGMSGDELETLRIAALLHDIGEIGISEKVLATPRDAMSIEDYRRYQQHPLRGQMMIDEIEDLRPVGVLIRHHHENYDGSGFPDGLAGEDIPLGARIIAYADQIDKITQTCSSGLAEQALAKTAHLVGKHLDPALAPAFKRLTKYIYFSKTNASDLVEVELNPKELTVGMQLSRDVCSGSGILLLKRGTTLDENKVIAIQRNYRLDPPEHGVFVTVSG
jgi:response regulator RpfG family c-di-GMP phosphodiesterase